MTTPNDAERTYSDERIDELLSLSDNGWDIGQSKLVAIIRQLRRDLDAARNEVEIDNKLLVERNRILDALPCPEHGACVPYVLEWIEQHRTETKVITFASLFGHTNDAPPVGTDSKFEASMSEYIGNLGVED